MPRVIVHKKLEGLAPRLIKDLEVALRERGDMGLSVPQEFDVRLRFYEPGSKPHSDANTRTVGSKPSVTISALPESLNYLGGENRKAVKTVMSFFDLTRRFISFDTEFLPGPEGIDGDNDEYVVILTMREPERTIRYLEDTAPEGRLAAYKDSLKKRRQDFDALKEKVIRTAKPAEESLARLAPVLQDLFSSVGFGSTRHEMDHVDFSTSAIYEDLHQSLEGGVNPQTLAKFSQAKTLSEVRALFFDHVPLNSWGEADMRSVEETVVAHYADEYINSPKYSEAVVGMVLKADNTTIDDDTANYISGAIDRRSRNGRFKFDPAKVDYRVAGKILHDQLPLWRIATRANAEIAAEAIGNAYRDDPRRLRAANGARSFQEFIEFCAA